MNPIAQALVDGLLFLEETVGASIVWAGETYPCTGGAETLSKSLDLGGLNIVSDVDIVVRTEVFPDGTGTPAEKQTLTYSSAEGVTPRRYRIDGVTPFQGALIVLHCNQATKGA